VVRWTMPARGQYSRRKKKKEKHSKEKTTNKKNFITTQSKARGFGRILYKQSMLRWQRSSTYYGFRWNEPNNNNNNNNNNNWGTKKLL